MHMQHEDQTTATPARVLDQIEYCHVYDQDKTRVTVSDHRWHQTIHGRGFWRDRDLSCCLPVSGTMQCYTGSLAELMD